MAARGCAKSCIHNISVITKTTFSYSFLRVYGGERCVTLASPSNVTIALKARSNIVQVLEDPSVVTVVRVMSLSHSRL